MSRGIILYQSKYGATKKYVDWLVEELGYDYAETKNSKVANLLNYDVIILGDNTDEDKEEKEAVKKNILAILKEKYRAVDRQEDCSICSWCFSI